MNTQRLLRNNELVTRTTSEQFSRKILTCSVLTSYVKVDYKTTKHQNKPLQKIYNVLASVAVQKQMIHTASLNDAKTTYGSSTDSHFAPVLVLMQTSFLPCHPVWNLLCISQPEPECCWRSKGGQLEMTSHLAEHNVLLLYNNEQTLKGLKQPRWFRISCGSHNSPENSSHEARGKAIIPF